MTCWQSSSSDADAARMRQILQFVHTVLLRCMSQVFRTSQSVSEQARLLGLIPAFVIID
jgi:hypothetical protein